MRIGVFGGTFDPIHVGHLISAEQCREQAELDEVWFVPAARPPHKLDRQTRSFHHRAEMLSLAVAGNAAFRVSDVEKDRPGPSFTVDTLEQLGRERPGDVFVLLVGSDLLPDLPTWREPAHPGDGGDSRGDAPRLADLPAGPRTPGARTAGRLPDPPARG